MKPSLLPLVTFEQYPLLPVTGADGKVTLKRTYKVGKPTLVHLNGAHVKTKDHITRWIIIHQTAGSTVRDMLQKWKNNVLVEHQQFVTGTNYSVDKNGDIIEWADPILYWTQSTKNSGVGPTVEQTVAVDFVVEQHNQLTIAQIRAGSHLIRLIAEKLKLAVIPVPFELQRKVSENPADHMSAAQMAKYTVLSHDTFASNSTECCGPHINISQLCTFATMDAKTKLAPIADGTSYVQGIK